MRNKVLKIIFILVIIFIIDCIFIKPSYPTVTFEITKEQPKVTDTKFYATVDYPGRAEEATKKYLAEKKEKEEQQRKITNRSETKRDEWIEFTATGYCSCSSCCGISTGITASGTKAQANHTVAMPKAYPFGTKIEIKNLGEFVVEDRGGAINGNKLDIYFNTHQEALNWGRRTVFVKVIEYE